MDLPLALLQSLETVPGFDRAAFEAVHNAGKQVVSVRFNPRKTIERDAWKKDPIPWCCDGYYLAERPFFTFDPVFHAGAYYVQEASSMFLYEALKQVLGEDTEKKVLDLCAAPGGKSSLLAAYFHNGLVVANEVIKTRAAILMENITKWGDDHVIVTNNDPAHFQSLPGFFDVMVVDAPCSGSGLFRKDADAILEWSEDNVQLCSQRQQRILSDALPALREEGILLYSTCSYSKEEDEEIADWLLEEMEMESIPLSIPADWGLVKTISAKQKATGYRFYPDRIRGEGFFISVFRKKTGATAQRLKEQNLQKLPAKDEKELRAFAQLPKQYLLFQQQETARALQELHWQSLQVLSANLYIKKAGAAVGTLKGRDISPAHEFAISHLWKYAFEPLPVNHETALAYLRRQEITLPEAGRGWRLLAAEGLPLGWIKGLPNRVNNYYPPEWRILKE